MAAAGIFRGTASAVANAAVPRRGGTYTVEHLERSKGSARRASGRWHPSWGETQPPPGASPRPANARSGMHGRCRLPLACGTGKTFSSRTSTACSAARFASSARWPLRPSRSRGRDDVARLRDEFGYRLAALEARAPSAAVLATMEDFRVAAHQQFAGRMLEMALRQADDLEQRLDGLIASGGPGPGRPGGRGARRGPPGRAQLGRPAPGRPAAVTGGTGRPLGQSAVIFRRLRARAASGPGRRIAACIPPAHAAATTARGPGPVSGGARLPHKHYKQCA